MVTPKKKIRRIKQKKETHEALSTKERNKLTESNPHKSSMRDVFPSTPCPFLCSLYPSATASSSYQPPDQLWKRIWHMHTAPKIRVFLWLASVKRLDAWLANRATHPRSSPNFEVIANLLWEIWCQRNNAIFRQQAPNSIQAIENAITQWKIFKSLQPPKSVLYPRNRRFKQRSTPC